MEKLEHVWSCLHTLSKTWVNFMLSTISSIRTMGQHKAQFTHFIVTNLTWIFMWVQESTEDMDKKNIDLLQIIIPEIMRILLAFSYFRTYSEIWSPPNIPLPTQIWWIIIFCCIFSHSKKLFPTKKKSRIQETKHLSTDADSSTDAIGGWTKANSATKKTFFCAAILDHFQTKMVKC